MGNGKPWQLLDLVRLDDADNDGVECYRVRGRFPTKPGHVEMCRELVRGDLGEEWEAHEQPSTFWVEKKRLVLVRFEGAMRFRDFRAEAVASYRPELDVEIPDGELAANIPTTGE